MRFKLPGSFISSIIKHTKVKTENAEARKTIVVTVSQFIGMVDEEIFSKLACYYKYGILNTVRFSMSVIASQVPQ